MILPVHSAYAIWINIISCLYDLTVDGAAGFTPVGLLALCLIALDIARS